MRGSHAVDPALPCATDGGRSGATAEWEQHARVAHETDALGTLCQLTTHAGLQPNAAEMFNNIVLRWGLITCCMVGFC